MLNFLRKFPMEWPDSPILSLPCQFQPLSVFLFWGQFLFLLQYSTRKKLANFLNFQSHPSRQPRLISFDSRRAYGHPIKLAVIQITLLRFALIINSFCMSMLLFFLYLPNPLLRTVDLFERNKKQKIPERPLCIHTLYSYGLQQIIILLILEFKTRWFAAILYMLKWFAGHQIRNVGVSFFPGYLQ